MQRGRPLNLIDAIRVSCNTTFGQLGMDVGGVALAEQAERFGFTTELGEQMPRVAPSQITTPELPPEQMDGATAAQTAIGQRDVRATPLQMAAVAAASARTAPLRAAAGVAPRGRGGFRDPALRAGAGQPGGQPATAATLTEACSPWWSAAPGARRRSRVQVAADRYRPAREGQNPNVWFGGSRPRRTRSCRRRRR